MSNSKDEFLEKKASKNTYKQEVLEAMKEAKKLSKDPNAKRYSNLSEAFIENGLTK